MRFHLGPIPSAPDFAPGIPDSLWRPLRAAPPWLGNLLSLPIGIVAAAILAGLWVLLTPLRELPWREMLPALPLPSFLLSFAGIVVVHEGIHALVHPEAGRSPHSILGFWPSVGFYASYDGEMSRNRLVAILLMPFLVISLAPLLVSAVTQGSCRWAAFISVFNAFLACADLLDAGLVLSQIPGARTVRFHGWRIYWKEHNPSAA